jgi:hypothetical protein
MSERALKYENEQLAKQIRYLLKENRRLCEWLRSSQLPFKADAEEVITNTRWKVDATVPKR